jgi:hypothetical protein
MLNVAGAQFQRALNYINEYTVARGQLSQVSVYLLNSFRDFLNTDVVGAFLTNIENHLNENVQKLTETYSPAVVQGYIMYYYQTFLTNLVLNNGTQAEIHEMNMLYLTKILSPNATDCITNYNQGNVQIYTNVATSFIKLMDNETSTTGKQLDSFRDEIHAMITELVKNLENIVGNKLTARALFDQFVRKL